MRALSILRPLFASASLVWLALAPARARAEEAPACSEGDATACGRREFEAGTAAFEKGDYAQAALRFRAALSARAHPVIRFNLALALARLGQPSSALVELGQVTRDPLSDKALKERAERETLSAEQALARVSFKLSDPSRERVELDAAPVDLAATQELSLDPGNHHVRVISNSSIVLDQELELAPGERVELRVGARSRRIDVVVVPEAVPAPAPSPPPRSRSAPRAKARPVSAGWFYVGAGATVVLTGLTVWSGVDTNRAYSDYERDLPQLSQAEADQRVSSGHARERRTNLLLGGSLLCGAASTVLAIWLVDFSGSRETRLGLAPSGVALSTRF